MFTHIGSVATTCLVSNILVSTRSTILTKADTTSRLTAHGLPTTIDAPYSISFLVVSITQKRAATCRSTTSAVTHGADTISMIVHLSSYIFFSEYSITEFPFTVKFRILYRLQKASLEIFCLVFLCLCLAKFCTYDNLNTKFANCSDCCREDYRLCDQPLVGLNE